MLDCAIIKPLGFVLIVTAHMLHSDCRQTDVIGFLNKNIILEFPFQNFTDFNSFAVYREGTNKIAACTQDKNCSGSNTCVFNRAHASVFYCIMNLAHNHSEIYWAALFPKLGTVMLSNKVHLIVQEDNTTSRDPPVPQNNTIAEETGGSSSFLFNVYFFAAVSFVAFLAVLLPWFIWCLMKNTEDQQQQISNPTPQEAAAASSGLPAPSPIYSVLDFPKRPQAALEIQSTDTEYAAVSYLSEKR